VSHGTAIIEVILKDDFFFVRGDAFPLAVFGPELLGCRELIEAKGSFLLGAESGAVVKDKPVAVGGKNERNIEGYGIIEGLLHAVADAVVVVLGFDDGDRDVWFVIKDIIGALGLPAGNEFSADDDAPFGKSDFLADLHHPVPARALDGGTDEFGADVAFAQVSLVYRDVRLSVPLLDQINLGVSVPNLPKQSGTAISNLNSDLV